MVTGQVEILSAVTPSVPTVVMTRTPGRWSGDAEPPHPAVEDLWLVSQRILARDTHTPLIVADDCGHQLPNEVPALVAYAISAVHSAVRHGGAVRSDPDHLAVLAGRLDA